MTSKVALHGILMWLSMGFLMPMGILTIRILPNNTQETGTRLKLLFYLHGIFQTLSVLVATVGAVMSIKNFENSFNNNHQRLGLALYGGMWVQGIIGFLRPPRGDKRRATWFFIHWILGTTICVVGIINIYTGLEAYKEKTGRSTWVWTILFTSQVCVIAFIYLFQDKWEYTLKQATNPVIADPQPPPDLHTQKVLLPLPCAKHNALQNLFD